MNEYSILITSDAKADLQDLRDYIAYSLPAPDTARQFLHNIKESIMSLSHMPSRYPLVSEEPWHSRGIRKLNYKNFYIYYRIDNSNSQIYILNVIFNRINANLKVSHF